MLACSYFVLRLHHAGPFFFRHIETNCFCSYSTVQIEEMNSKLTNYSSHFLIAVMSFVSKCTCSKLYCHVSFMMHT